MSKKTVIVGASPNKARYAYLAADMLSSYGHPIVPLGIKKGEVVGEPILDLRTKPSIEDVDTVTLYLRPDHQEQWADYLLSLNPKRIIFNPGTENASLAQRAEAQGIEATEGCTLVMLRSRQF